MGGQKGGLRDEKGHFPAVCNKSVVARLLTYRKPFPLNFLEGGGESQQILKFISPLTNVKKFSLDGIDSELFLPRINGQH